MVNPTTLEDFASGCFALHMATALQRLIAKELGLHSELREVDDCYEVVAFDVTPRELRALKRVEHYFTELA